MSDDGDLCSSELAHALLDSCEDRRRGLSLLFGEPAVHFDGGRNPWEERRVEGTEEEVSICEVCLAG